VGDAIAADGADPRAPAGLDRHGGVAEAEASAGGPMPCPDGRASGVAPAASSFANSLTPNPPYFFIGFHDDG
jgi:hypothetical protein